MSQASHHPGTGRSNIGAPRPGRRRTAGEGPAGHDPKLLEEGGESQDLKSDSGELSAGLHVLATPIGNARDISLRALRTLKDCDAIAAEDTRVTAKLLAIHGISRPLIAYNDHNGAAMRPRILARLAAGQKLVLVSDAGTPLVSDPGYKLVRAALEAGLPVHAVPGPSAVLAGLTLSGLPSDRFLFVGFLPHRAGERRTALAGLSAIAATLIFFESAQRLGESLAAMAEVLGDRPAAVARELTKLHEDVRRGPLRELAAHYAAQGAPRGEVTVLVGPPLDEGTDWTRIDTALGQALAFMPVRAAADMIAALSGAPRKPIYARALQIRALRIDGDGQA